MTRRRAESWGNLRPDDLLVLVEKGMGLAKGERQVVLATVLVTSNEVETLGQLTAEEVAAEGFPGHGLHEWRMWWAKSHGHRVPSTLRAQGLTVEEWVNGLPCRRIEWRYLTDVEVAAVVCRG